MQIKANPHLQSLKPYQPGKPIQTVEQELGLTDVVKLASNENPLGPSPRAIKAVNASLKQLNRYPDGGCYDLKVALAKRHGVSAEGVVIGNGSNELIELIVHAFVSEGDQIIFALPSFVAYPLIAESHGVTYVTVSLAADYQYSVDGYLSALTPQTKAIFIANPNNPTGTYLTVSDLNRLLAGVPDGVLVVMDEAYFDYAAVKGDFPDSMMFQGAYANLITLRSFSKSYGLAGIRIGYGIAHRDIADYLNRARQPFNVNTVAQVAAVAALKDTEHLHRSVANNQAGERFLMDALRRIPNITVVPSAGNFLFIDLHRDANEIYTALLQHGVIVRPMGGWGVPTAIRVSIGLPAENQRFIDTLKKVI